MVVSLFLEGVALWQLVVIAIVLDLLLLRLELLLNKFLLLNGNLLLPLETETLKWEELLFPHEFLWVHLFGLSRLLHFWLFGRIHGDHLRQVIVPDVL